MEVSMVRLAWLRVLDRLLASDERGASYVEYVLIAGLVCVVCIIAMSLLGDSTVLKTSNVATLVSAS
jgi:Flp pilus assembly pilin Flp